MLLRSLALPFVLTTACNPQNTQDACNDVGHAYCQRIFDLSNQGCANAASFLADHSYASLNDCMTGFTFIGGATCATITTDACLPDDFNGSRAATCSHEVGSLSCDYDWTHGPLSSSEECAHICCVHSGNAGSGMECCSGTSHLAQTSGCSFSAQESICD